MNALKKSSVASGASTKATMGRLVLARPSQAANFAGG
jgi:hypothetical protein